MSVQKYIVLDWNRNVDLGTIVVGRFGVFFGNDINAIVFKYYHLVFVHGLRIYVGFSIRLLFLKVMDDSDADIGVQTQMATYTVLPGSSEPLVFPFLCEYKTPSVFDKEPLETAMHEHRFNETVIYALDNTTFDMLSDLMIKVTLPDISSYNARWANTTGHTLVEYACVVHNDLELARYTGESLNILFQLDTNAGHYRARCEMVNHKATSTALDGRKQVLYIEIPFFKSNEDKQMFPALLEQDI